MYFAADGPNQMYVVWSTQSDTNQPMVIYKEFGTKTKLLSKGKTRKFTDGGIERRTQFIHRVKLMDLLPGQKYGEVVVFCLY